MSTENKPTLTDRIADRINPAITSQTGLTKSGSMSFNSVEQIMEFAKVMSIASVAIPKHLRENPGACLAVAIQASEWEMSPFSVANKSYVVNDRIAYEAQLINAVILRRAPIVGRFKISYSGDGDTRKCKVVARLTQQEGGEEVEYESPAFKTIPVKNSPLWKGDPDQQLFYYSSRAMCRRHFPDVLLGVYAVDEIQDTPEIEATVTRPVIDTSKSKPIEDKTEGQRDVERSEAAAAEHLKHVAAEKEQSKPRQPRSKAEKPAEPDKATMTTAQTVASGMRQEVEAAENFKTQPAPREQLAMLITEAGFTVQQALWALRVMQLVEDGAQSLDSLADTDVADVLADAATLVTTLQRKFPAK